MKKHFKLQTNFLKRTVIIILLFNSFFIYSQDGSLDLTFNSLNNLSTMGSILDFGTQSDGKTIIVGHFTSVNGVNVGKIARLNIDGSLDTSFNIGTGITGSSEFGNNHVKSILVLPDDKIIIGGTFNNFNGVIKNSILRLNSDGSIDQTFNSGNGFITDGYFTNNIPGQVNKLKLRPNGQIVAVGAFRWYNNISLSHVAVLNSNGTLDTTFSFQTLLYGNIDAFDIQSDGKMIFASTIRTYFSGAAAPQKDYYLRRINQNGSLDNTFTLNNTILSQEDIGGVPFSNNGEYLRINDIKCLSSGKIIVAGDFTNKFGTNKRSISRLNSNGTVDNTYIGIGTNNNNNRVVIYSIDIQSDGKILLGGKFSTFSNMSLNNIARVNQNGSYDNTFISGTGFSGGNDPIYMQNNRLYLIKKLTNNKIVCIGDFNNYNSIIRNSIARLNSNIVANNDIGTSTSGTTTVAVSNVRSNDTYNGVTATSSNTTLSFISSTNAGITLNTTTGAVTVASTVPAGTYTLTYQICANDNPTNCATGTVTITVNPQPEIINAVNDDFSSTQINYINGGVTPSVTTNDTLNGIPVNNSSITISLTNNGGLTGATINNSGIITVPAATNVGTYTLTYKICQNTNPTNCDQATVIVNVYEPAIETPDIVFGVRANNGVYLIEQQSNGKSIISGAFTTYNNINALKLTRLNTNLTLDNTFLSTGPIPSGQTANDLKIQSDDKIIVVGSFTSFNNGTNGRGIVRLNIDGTVDTSFNSGGTGVGSNDRVRSCAIQPDGKILIGGSFITSYNGLPCKNLIRLNTDGTIDNTFNYHYTTNTFGRLYSAIFNIVVQPDGKILIAGIKSGLPEGQPTLLRLNSDGSLDTNFTIGDTGTDVFTSNCTSCSSPIQKVYLLPDNKIILVGVFNSYNGNSSYKNIVRLMPNGAIDTTFNGIGTSSDRVIKDLAIDTSTGKLFVAGEFTTFNNASVTKIIRLNPNGSIDNSFSAGTGTAHTNTSNFVFNSIHALKRQNDGKVILGGHFTSYNGISALNITRIKPSIAGAQARGINFYESEPEIDINQIIGEVKIYPNPSSDIINIDLTENNENFKTIEVYDLLGKIVYKNELNPKSVNEINLINIQKGYYIAKIYGNEISKQIKLIKK